MKCNHADLRYRPGGKALVCEQCNTEAEAIIAELRGEIARLRALCDELSEHLVDTVNQACRQRDGTLDSNALSANADAMRLCAQLGKLKISHEYGRRVIGEWVKEGER